MPKNYIWAWGMAEERKKLTIPDLAATGERLVMVAIGEVLSGVGGTCRCRYRRYRR